MKFELFYETSGICTDTRNIRKDCLFVCLKGAHFNGNTFASQALENGAKYVIADEEEFVSDERIFLVPDALKFLQQLANYHRKKFNIPVIGITGSNGKTSSKELISAVLSQKFNVLHTQGNLNNHIGVPLTLLQLTREHEIAVVEMGANKFGDIEELCLIAEPTHGLITNIGKAHLEGFLDFEGVLKTKRELYDFVATHHGTIFYNADDDILVSALPSNVSTFSYASQRSGDVEGTLITLDPFVHMQWRSGDFQSEEIRTNMIGKYNFYNFLAAISIGSFFAVPPEAISRAIAGYTPTNNRSQVQKTANNTLIMDAYNANPTSMRSALESFALIDHPAKVAILGDMFELGKESGQEHRNVIELSRNLGIDAYFVGERFHQAMDGSVDMHFFKDKELARQFLSEKKLHDKLILLKGSRGIGLESLTDLL